MLDIGLIDTQMKKDLILQIIKNIKFNYNNK